MCCCGYFEILSSWIRIHAEPLALCVTNLNRLAGSVTTILSNAILQQSKCTSR